MAETSVRVDPEIEANQGSSSVTPNHHENGKDHNIHHAATPDVPNTAMKLERVEQVYESDNRDIAGKPTKGEVWVWYLYELCSYFIHNTLVPVLFPLIISQALKLPPEPVRGWGWSRKGFSCGQKETKLYEALTHQSISINSSKFSPLQWTSFSWGIGLILVAPIIGSISPHLDYGRKQVLITGATIAIGAFFCLPTGFFNVTWIFPPYIAAIVAASIVATASHTRQLALMVKGFTGPNLQHSQFQTRRGVSSWLSLYATAAGGVGSAIISSFIYHMLKHGEQFVSLWVVSIFSGLKWLLGVSHVFFVKPGSSFNTFNISTTAHFLSIFKYPHALGTLVLAFLSSFTTMCIFTGAVLYLIGDLCFKPLFILYIWLTYFIFPIISMPLIHPLQQVIKASAAKMHLLGFYLSIATAAVGFYYRGNVWHRGHVVVLAALQGTSVGLLHAFGRVLLIDCSPHGREGAFSAWFSWWRALGSCVGFAIASAIPGNVSTSFGISFGAAIFGTLLLSFGNISDFRGAMAAGLVNKYEDADVEGISEVHGSDNSFKQENLREESLA
ncbi:uncharacterized protein LOC8283020 [Ricinus communis]|uniref:Transporter n=1 Tax=Ricinus communis TaxID=3988 RepID=B9S1E7_RICCO|nr:uncharacterized protein LOC8283020 [Ricinus communis]EEF42568.1 conserved hypothetical protein [Ricinus communis]|eukprot:XP_002519964.3 uncharacterized protein LOC8283020 [Ricinus communis]